MSQIGRGKGRKKRGRNEGTGALFATQDNGGNVPARNQFFYGQSHTFPSRGQEKKQSFLSVTGCGLHSCGTNSNWPVLRIVMWD